MAQLIRADFNQLVPQLGLLGQGFEQGQRISQNMANRQALAQQQEQAAQLSGQQQLAAGGDQAALQQVAGQDPQAARQIQQLLASQDEAERAEGLRENEVLTRTALDALSIEDPGKRRLFLERQKNLFVEQGRSTTNIDRALSLDDDGLNQAITLQARQGKTISELAQQQFPDTEQLIRTTEAETARAKEARLATKAAAPIPDVLLQGLSEDVSAKASASFSAAGGGEKGLKAFAKVVDKATEQERRLASPAIIQSSFPNATQAEVVQLQATMDAARTTETGLKAAKDVREAQRTTKKAKTFQQRGVALLDSILENEQLGDVVGSIEGGIDFRFSDVESELIDDINEVGDILTADNLNLMSGVLSESDIKILRALAGGGLKRTRTEERFRKDVTALRDKLGASEVLTADDIQQGRDGTIPSVNEKGFKLMVDAQGNRAFVGPNGEIEEVNNIAGAQ